MIRCEICRLVPREDDINLPTLIFIPWTILDEQSWMNNPGWTILCLNPSSVVRTLNSLTPSTHPSCNPFSLDREILITFHSINHSNMISELAYYGIVYCLPSCWEYHASVLLASIFFRIQLMTFNGKKFRSLLRSVMVHETPSITSGSP